MRPYLSSLLCFIFLVLPIRAQDEALVCQTPFTAALADETIIMRVNDVAISSTQFADRVRFEHAYNAITLEIQVTLMNDTAAEYGTPVEDLIASNVIIQQIMAENDNLEQLGNRVLGELAADAIIWDYAQANDIAIFDEAFNASLEEFFAFSDETIEEQQAIIDSFSQRILINGTPPQQLTTFFCRETVYHTVQEQVIMPTDTTLYVNADHILVSSQAVAQDIVTLLDAGNDFATLADELSLDITQGGALGWQPAIFLPVNFTQAVTNGEVNTILDIIQTQFGWHVIRLNQREERPIPDELRATIENTRFERWQGEQVNRAEISINPDWQLFLPQL